MIAPRQLRYIASFAIGIFSIVALLLIVWAPQDAPAPVAAPHCHASHPHEPVKKRNLPSANQIRNAATPPAFRTANSHPQTGIAAAETMFSSWTGQTDTAFRARAIVPAATLTSGSPMERGVRFSLPLFDDYVFNAVVQESFVNVNGTVSTLAHSDDSPWARAAIAYTNGELRIKVLAPEKHRAFAIHYNHTDGHHYALELDPVILKKHEQCGLTPDSPFRNPSRTQASNTSTPREKITVASRAVVDETVASALVDVMVVYAENAVTEAGSESTILNIAAQGIALANDVHQVSDTGILIHLVHTAKLDGYQDSGTQLNPADTDTYPQVNVNDTELRRLSRTSDGINDHIHTLRDQVGADFVCMLTTDPFGGLGTVGVFAPTDLSGEPDTAFNVNGWSVFDSYVPVHELGHNMGLVHSKFQAVSPGSPSPTTGSYAAGWYWHLDNNITNDGYSSIMSYDEHFDNHANLDPNNDPFHLGHAEVGLFSNTVPELSMFGQATGDAIHADARRALRERRSAYASYRTRSTLGNPELFLREPSSARSWPTNTSQAIIWESKNIGGNIKIELYRAGVFYQTITADTLNDGIFYWQLPPELPQATDYKIRVSSIDSPALSDLSDDPFIVSQIIYSEPLDSDPGYSKTGSWEFGVPTLANAVFSNATFGGPEAARTGTTIYDTNLTGGYGNTENQQLTSVAVDCGQFENCRLIFYGQLGITENTTALIETSNDGTNWTSLLSTSNIAQSAWQRYELDISAIADEQSSVFFRWSLNHAGGSFQSGFAVDDISVIGNLAKRVSYSNNRFDEAEANDGSIGNSIMLSLSAETFSGSPGENLVATGKATVTNIPTGLTAALLRLSSTEASLILSGTANAHEKSDDATNLTITLTDSAFIGGDASIVVDATRANLIVDFFTSPPYSLEFTSGGNGAIDGPTSQPVEEGDDSVTVSAIPNVNHHFVNWTGTFTSTDNPLIITNVQADTNLTANFAPGEGNFPYFESFEAGTGIWTNIVGTDDLNWDVETGPSQFANQAGFESGPSEAFHLNSYLSLVDSQGTAGVAILEAEFGLLHTTIPTFRFEYHMLGAFVSNLKIEVSDNDGASWQTQFTRSGDQGNSWFEEEIDLSPFAGQTIKVRVAATSGDGSLNGTIAIDAIAVFDRATHHAITFLRVPGGQLEGELIQLVPIGQPTTPVTAVADANQTFGGWSGTALTTNPIVIESVTTDATIRPLFPFAAFPYSESFETDLGLWTQSASDGLDWARRQTTSSFILNDGFGPAVADDGNFFASLEDPHFDGDFTSETGSTLGTFSFENLIAPEISFSYHLTSFGSNATLAFEASTDGGNSWSTLFTRTGDQGDIWQTKTVSLLTFAGEPLLLLRFRGVSGQDFRAVSAVDNISIIETAGTLTYTPSTFFENAANDGSIGNSVTISLTNLNFTTEVVNDGHVVASNLPAGLSASFIRDSDTQLTMTLTGNATSHVDNADAFDLTVSFGDDAFGGATVPIVVNSTTDNLIVDFADPDSFTIQIANPTISEDGGTSTSTVSRTGSSGDVTVNLISDKPDEATVPSTVVISDGNTTSPTFTITAQDDAVLDGTQQVTVTASAPNFVSGSANLAVDDDAVVFITSVSPVASGTTEGPGPVDPDASPFPISATPATGFHFVNWTVLSGGATFANATQPTTEVSTITSARIQANFAINQYALTYQTDGNGSITGASNQTINHGSDGTAVTATPLPGFVFVNWADLSTQNPRQDTAITTPATHTASFAIDPSVLTFSATVTSTATDPETVHFGNWDQTVAGFDPNIDVPSLGTPRIWLADNTVDADQALAADYRPTSTHTYWRLIVAPGDSSVDLTFDLSNRPPDTVTDTDTAILLQPFRNESATAPAIDIVAIQGTISVSSYSEFLIAIGPSDSASTTLLRGWNWISIPLISTAGLDDFLSPNQTPLYVGNRHTIGTRGRLIPNTGAILPERGSLVYSPQGGESATISGIRPDGIVPIQPGWNAITMPNDIPASSTKLLDILANFQVFHWSPTRRRYSRISNTSPLQQDQTYHLAPRDNSTTRYNFILSP